MLRAALFGVVKLPQRSQSRRIANDIKHGNVATLGCCVIHDRHTRVNAIDESVTRTGNETVMGDHHGVNPLTEDGDLVFATAHALGIRCMVHTGAGIPFSLPALCIPAANKYPDLKIVLAHAGGGIVSAEAQVAASICGNLYLETSWCLGEDIRWMINTIGPDRVMMGADLPSNVPVEFAKYRALDLEPEVYNKVMGETAVDVFNLKW